MTSKRKPIAAVARAHPIIAGLFVLAFGATVFFGGRTLSNALYWADPAHRNMAIEAWMTPGYVAHSWGVPRDVVGDAIGTRPETRGATLDAIAQAQGIRAVDLITRIDMAIAAHNQARGQ